MDDKKPWLRHYEPHVPDHIDYPAKTLSKILEETSLKHASYPAIIFKGRQLTFGELNHAVNQFAAGLQQIDVKKGDRVAIHLPNCPQFPIAYFGILRAGAIVVPCNPLYTAYEMTRQLNDAGAEVILTLSSTYPLIRHIRSATTLRKVIVAKIKTYFPPVLKLLFTVLM
jgi:long-chain acyl-CoA synthetase